ncbi:hypothetical protein LR032_04615 [Candidatus Bipolaricaulota bacterium]|nr:hypothetical protein [Candidatus Bipolaricaulota bacterium]
MSELQPLLIFGDPFRCEQALAARCARILAEAPKTERHTLFGDDLNLPGLMVELQTASLFAASRHFVVRRTGAIKAKPFALLLERELSPGTHLTFLAPGLKGTSPLIKTARACGSVQALPPLKGRNLERAASELLAARAVSLDAQGVKGLLLRTGGDLLALSQEAQKLHSFSQGGVVDLRAFGRLVFSGGEESIYPFLDCVGEGDLQASLRALSTLNEDPVRIIAGIVRHLTRLLMVRILLDSRLIEAKIAPLLGSSAWIVRRLAAQAKGHSAQRLTAALDLGIDLDLEVKRGGVRPADALLKLILYVTTPFPLSAGCARQNRLSPAASG